MSILLTLCVLMITCSVLNLRYDGTVYWVMRTACFQLWFCEIKCGFKNECGFMRISLRHP